MRRAGLAAMLVVLSASSWADTFTKHPKRFQVGPNPTAIIAPDLNGDGWPEIITADIGTLTDPLEERPAHDQLSFLVAQGDLVYAPQPQLQTGFAPYCIVAANMDAPKALDLVVGSFHDAARRRHVSLFRNLGENLFEPLHFHVPDEDLPYTKMLDADERPMFTKPGITSLIVTDIDHDGYRDVVATGWASDVLIFLPGAPDTYLGQPKLTPARGGPRDLAAADFNGDGETDLVTTMYSTGELALWEGRGDGHFEQACRFRARGKLPHKVRAADVNGDGETDLVVSDCYDDDSIALFYGDGEFQFSVSQEIMLGKDREVLEHEIRDIIVRDLTGDGRPDVAVACYASSQVIVLFNKSEDNRLPQAFRKESYTYEDGKPRALCVADFNQDTRLDIGVALWHANEVALLLQNPPR